MMRNHENIDFFLNCAVFDPDIALNIDDSGFSYHSYYFFFKREKKIAKNV